MVANFKKNQKSVRLTDEVLAYVENAPGDGFNQKFENLVLEMKRTEPERKKRLTELEHKISLKQKQLSVIVDSVESLDITIQAIFSLQEEVHRIQAGLSKILRES